MFRAALAPRAQPRPDSGRDPRAIGRAVRSNRRHADFAIAQEARRREPRLQPDHDGAQWRLSLHCRRQAGVVMLRFTLATRLALITIVGFSAIAIVLIGIFYLTTVRENEDARPSPGRLAALADLIERTAPETRQLMLAAVSSPQFIARVEASTGADPAATLAEKAVRT